MSCESSTTLSPSTAEIGTRWSSGAPTFAADAKELGAQLEILDKAIAGKPFIAGDKLTLADIALGPVLHRCLDFPIQLPALTNLRAWRDRLKEKASFKKATAG